MPRSTSATRWSGRRSAASSSPRTPPRASPPSSRSASPSSRGASGTATFGLVHGAWHGAWCWERLIPELGRLGHRAVAMDLPREDAEAGPAEYAQAVADALAGETGVVLVGHSLGGITIPNVAALRPVSRVVYLCALVPSPGRSFDESHLEGNIGSPGFDAAIESLPDGSAVLRRDAIASLYPDAPRELAERAWERCGRQTWGITHKPSLDYPATPASYILCRDDLAILPEWSRRTAREQLGVEPLELDGDHSPFLSRPAALAEMLAGLP